MYFDLINKPRHWPYTRRFIMFSVITNIYNKKTKGPALMEMFIATGKLILFLTTTDVRNTQKTVPNPFNVIFSG
jgi:hypothetical protein